MLQINDLTDLQTLTESVELECKLAQGKDGRGKLPDDFWPTYSAMANCRGGCVILGIKEKKGKFSVAGIQDISVVRKQLFDILSNKNKININLLTDKHISESIIEGKNILVINIPPARREQKPIYLNNQPMTESWLRAHDGDHRCTEEQVRRMMAEQVEESRDNRILQNFDMNDISQESLQAYRQLLSTSSPTHPALELDNFNFLRSIGGWRKDRQTGNEGMTLAGILMFGTWESIQDAAPNYFVDYQERPEAKTERRWIDRLCPDGTWSGNVFDFYRRTYRKLIADLKIPFELKDGIRQDDTQIHTALREALVNTLVHADYTGRLSIMVVKRPDLFGFRNPGMMRIPPEQAIRGYESDCRNRLIHQMFLMIGAGERSGSGIPKIFSGWRWANWRVPRLYEKAEPEQTLLELSIGNLVSEKTAALLYRIFGEQVNKLNELERGIVITTAVEGWIDHERACQLTTQHSREVTLTLPRLVCNGFLIAHGEKRNKSYTLPGHDLPSPEELFTLNPLSSLTSKTAEFITDKGEMITDNDSLITDNNDVTTSDSHKRDHVGRFITDKLPAAYIDDFNFLSSSLQRQLIDTASPAREKRRLPNDIMDKIILSLCQGHFMPLSVIAMLTKRTPQNIREKQLIPLVKQGKLRLAFPHVRRHKKQGYMTVQTPTT
ncbi:AAA family ATPase [Edwardsiella ictaluri]|uniref:Divergent AAA domain protein n=1 Tax=Edwardsiella ictaluri (strain 93-146) TaxID=634503 RepID=C5BDH7_EDWI9|nr:RNA-binding domain-containing protein [Edwardsiella ictaluri]ACR67593.1 Divergent AAA domain protein [Edwardsiella ictaluri 93-146]AVZ81930.1 AAA family ATPase [Edwardsiella ictaluri]EKS7762271.1 putative DNA binding domain-containing protein [Edwardsiella ictaluri]EKS7769098.1 putative DNA binding domain-containing protein [Edwardsiella ictaluri]EKS7772247.1 putative DNA binding domain-containing protein [Edwardsiella ictaluri]